MLKPRSYLPLFIGIFLCSCYSPRYIYSPSATNVPVLNHKGDSKLALYYSGSSLGRKEEKFFYNYGFDMQSAYALNKHWALLFNQSNRYEKNSGDFDALRLDSAVITYKRSVTEIGGGYFTPFFDSSHLSFQFMGGLGIGKFTMHDNGKDAANQYYSRYHEVGITKAFLQPALQVRYSKYFTTSFAARFSILWYHGIKTNYTAAEQESFLLNELTQSPKTFWEPAVINSFSLKKLPAYRFELQFDFASLVSSRFVDYRSVNVSIGAMVDLSELKRK